MSTARRITGSGVRCSSSTAPSSEESSPALFLEKPRTSANYYAHTSEAKSKSPTDNSCWHPLVEHLQSVGDKAREFAEPLLADAAQQAGLLHDLGKYRLPFQKYLSGECSASVETHHAVYGAALAFKRGWLGPAFSIAGHHAGLHDISDLQELICGEKYDAMNCLTPSGKAV